MKELNIREMRASIGRLAELVEAEGELVISRRGQPIARVLPFVHHRQAPSHDDLRQLMPRLHISSAELIRTDRDGR